jgi:sensor histidine kinase YesM
LGNRWVQYLRFWGLAYYILARHFSYDSVIEDIDLIYTALFLLSIWLAVGANSFWLIPEFLAKSKYFIYVLSLIVNLAVATWFNTFTFDYLSSWIFPGYYFISYYSWEQILQFVLVFVGVTTLLQLSKSWFREVEVRQYMAELEREKTKTELKALRAQINPHFLFNSLNHVYSLAVQKSSKTASAVLHLSQLLRYALQNMNKEKVSLKGELEYIRQFVELYKSRIHHPKRIQFEINGEAGDLEIAPLLLVVFIENCFKHGSINQEEEFITINLHLNQETLSLSTQNKVDSHTDLPKESTELGLDNAKRRLQLLYPDKHRFEFDRKEDEFNVELEMDLS